MFVPDRTQQHSLNYPLSFPIIEEHDLHGALSLEQGNVPVFIEAVNTLAIQLPLTERGKLLYLAQDIYSDKRLQSLKTLHLA